MEEKPEKLFFATIPVLALRHLYCLLLPGHVFIGGIGLQYSSVLRYFNLGVTAVLEFLFRLVSLVIKKKTFVSVLFLTIMMLNKTQTLSELRSSYAALLIEIIHL